MKSLDVKLPTSDGVEIAGTYIPGSLPAGVIFLHMMPADRQSYAEFSEQVALAGFHTLTIDLRGHGESEGGDYRNFSEDQHQKSILDVLAAADYMKKQYPDMRIGLVGASIGANLALQYAATNPTLFAVLLSPGLNYYGLETRPVVAAVPENIPIYFASSLDDKNVEGNSTQTETLYGACSSNKKTIQVFKEGGHGTDMLKKNNFQKSLLDWMLEATQQRSPA